MAADDRAHQRALDRLARNLGAVVDRDIWHVHELGGADRPAGLALALRDSLPRPLDATSGHAGGHDRGVRHLACQLEQIGSAGCDHNRDVWAAAELERAAVPSHDLAVEL